MIMNVAEAVKECNISRAEAEAEIPGILALSLLAACGIFAVANGITAGVASKESSILSRCLGVSKRELVLGKLLAFAGTSLTWIIPGHLCVPLVLLCFGLLTSWVEYLAALTLLLAALASYATPTLLGIYTEPSSR